MCGCADRMAEVLRKLDWRREGDNWVKEGFDPIPHDRVEDDHTRLLVETMYRQVQFTVANKWLHKLGR